MEARGGHRALKSRWNRAGIDPATRQIYMKGPSLYKLILHTKWKELKVCGVVVRLLQRIGWLQCKICRGWTLDFGNSKIRNSQCEIGVSRGYASFRFVYRTYRT